VELLAKLHDRYGVKLSRIDQALDRIVLRHALRRYSRNRCPYDRP
jgi:hypothetical protein